MQSDDGKGYSSTIPKVPFFETVARAYEVARRTKVQGGSSIKIEPGIFYYRSHLVLVEDLQAST